jgi:hypothetical protein
MALAGVLKQACLSNGKHKFIVKGGVAMELRLCNKARATKDLDLVLEMTDGDLLNELEAVLGDPYDGFNFRRKGEPIVMPNGALRTEIQLSFKGQPWASVPIDIARAEMGGTAIEEIPTSSNC